MPLFSAFACLARQPVLVEQAVGLLLQQQGTRLAHAGAAFFGRPPNMRANISCMFCGWMPCAPGRSIMPMSSAAGSAIT